MRSASAVSSSSVDDDLRHEEDSESDSDSFVADVLFPRASNNVATAARSNKDEHGVWIGVDLGTSNCCCAVWDTVLHRARTIRFPTSDLAAPSSSDRSKETGTTVPSVLTFFERDDDDGDDESGSSARPIATDAPENVGVWVGRAAVRAEENHDDHDHDDGAVTTATMRSFKRSLGVDDGPSEPRTEITPLRRRRRRRRGASTTPPPSSFSATPAQATTLLLRELRVRAERALRRSRDVSPVGLDDPSDRANLVVRHACVGVPASYSRARRATVVACARAAGFDGVVTALAESTAAAAAYGLLTSNNANHANRDRTRILVLDVGGGTTDATVVALTNDDDDDESPRFRVEATAGDLRCGGDDVDQALSELCRSRVDVKEKDSTTKTTDENRRSRRREQALLRACRRAKETLCGDDSTVDEVDVACPDPNNNYDHDARVTLTRKDVDACSTAVAAGVRRVVREALSSSSSDAGVDEIVLVGGASRLPAVRETVRAAVPRAPSELCVALHPGKAAAQGAAIAAAAASGRAPPRVLRDALALDALPHAIGAAVRRDDDDAPPSFAEILPRHAPLPAAEHRRFVVGDRRGVTVEAVENVSPASSTKDDLRPLGEFTFLLHRRDDHDDDDLATTREVDVGMTVTVDGKFIVSVFDEHDPEHVAKRERYVRQRRSRKNNGDDDGDGRTTATTTTTRSWREQNEGPTSTEQVLLTVACVVLFASYLVARIAFAEVSNDAQIL